MFSVTCLVVPAQGLTLRTCLIKRARFEYQLYCSLSNLSEPLFCVCNGKN